MITGGLGNGSPPSPTHQGVRAGRIGHDPLAVDTVEPEEPEYLGGPLQLAIGHGALPGVHGSDFAPAAQGRGVFQGVVDAPVESLAEKAEQAPELVLGAREEALVESEVDLPRSELPQGHVVLDAPREEVALEGAASLPDLGLYREQEVVNKLLLLHRLREDVPPPEREPGRDDRAGVSEEENDGHAGEVPAHPAEEQVGPYVLDEAPPGDEPAVEPVRPRVPQPAGEHGPRRPEVLRAPVVGPQVLLAPEMPEYPNLAGVEGLEDEAVPVAVVDHLRDPRRSAPPAPGQEDGAPVVPLPQIRVEHAEKPEGGRADQRGAPASVAFALAASLTRSSSPAYGRYGRPSGGPSPPGG